MNVLNIYLVLSAVILLYAGIYWTPRGYERITKMLMLTLPAVAVFLLLARLGLPLGLS